MLLPLLVPALEGTYSDLTSRYGDDKQIGTRSTLKQASGLMRRFSIVPDDGDLELALYAPDGVTLLDQSTSILDVDDVSLARSEQAGAYLLRVYL